MMSYTMALGEWRHSKDIVRLCRFARELGLEAVDWLTTYGTPPAEVKKICDDHGLKIACYTFGADINFPDAKSRQPGIDKIKEGIETALMLGTDKIMLPISGKEGQSRQESRRNCIEGLKDAVLAGNRCGVTVTVEHFPNRLAPFIISSDMSEAIREVPGLKVTYDPGNALTGGEDPVQAYLNSKDDIVFAHFKDFSLSDPENSRLQGADGKYYISSLVGEGLIDYPAIVKAMTENNYKGYINFEYEGKKFTPEEAMVRGLPYLKKLFEEAENG